MQINLIGQYPYSKPDELELGQYYNQEHHRIRFAHMPATAPLKAQVVMMGAQTDFIEAYHETFRNLAERGIETYYVERYGDGGSDRQLEGETERQKPSTVPIETHSRDLGNFINKEVKRDSGIPFGFLSQCQGSLIGTLYMMDNPETFNFAVMTSPLYGSAITSMNNEEDERKMLDALDMDGFEHRYIGRNSTWSVDNISALYERNTTDKERAAVNTQWQIQYPELRSGGFTFGNIATNLQSILKLLEKGTIEKISTPVTILSPTEDKENNLGRHHEFGGRMQNARVIDVKGARHNLWHENNTFREVVFEEIEKEITFYQTLRNTFNWL